jgi:hypothetical protein
MDGSVYAASKKVFIIIVMADMHCTIYVHLNDLIGALYGQRNLLFLDTLIGFLNNGY